MPLVLSSAIFAPTFVDSEVAHWLGDDAYVRALLDVEAALARVQGRLGIIPRAAAVAIESAAASLSPSLDALAAGVARDGVPIPALIAELRKAAGNAGEYVHFGATSQDIMDNAATLELRRVLAHARRRLLTLIAQLAELAELHRHTLMVARTHGQQALPTTFGLKVAVWASPLPRHLARLKELEPRLYVLQLGGAAGTLAALGPRALELEQALASELGLGVLDAPWHAQRDGIAELGGWLCLVAGSLGKLAQDVILLSQTEVGEVGEAVAGQRGGSSSMPQKNNPMRSEQILAAARASAVHQSGLLQALVQEHERATHGWQLEWLCLAPLLALVSGALARAVELTRELCVYPERMRDNLLAEHGLVLAEAAVGALNRALPRPRARELVTSAAARARTERRNFLEVLREDVAAVTPAPDVDWPALAEPQNYLGQANALTDRVLAGLRRAAAG